MLCVPVLQAEGGLDSVIELIKTDNKIPFTPQEEEVQAWVVVTCMSCDIHVSATCSFITGCQ